MKTYRNKRAAVAAAKRYQKENGGVIVCGFIGEDVGDKRLNGVYEFVAVAINPTDDNPLGDAWEEFPYNYLPAK